MKNESISLLFSLLRSVLHNTKISDNEKPQITSEIISEVVKIASKHDIAHLVALGLINNNLVSEETKPQLEQYIYNAVYRFEQQNYESEQVCLSLEEAQIKFLPLKGSVLRKFYYEPWMRTSCDIDILVHKDDLDYAVSCIEGNLKYSKKEHASHDVSFFSPQDVHLELHFDLVEEGRVHNSIEILKSVWDNASVCEGSSFCYEMTEEFFCFYHIAHMAKHFENGGCGIRPFIDLYIIKNKMQYNESVVRDYFRQSEIEVFYDNMLEVSEVWFGDKHHSDISRQIEEFILKGGVYGSLENKVSVSQSKKGSKIKYALSRIFLSYNSLKILYPILNKHKWLFPFMQVRRWFSLIFRGRLKKAKRELSINSNITKGQAMDMKDFLERVGL